MRKITINQWVVTDPAGEAILNKDGTKKTESLLTVLSILVSNRNPANVPTGLNKFKLYRKLVKAFENAEKTGILSLEESEYKFLLESVEKDIPATWGMNPDLSNAVDMFVNAKEE